MKLRDIAHARAGDKGRTNQICVIAYDQKDYGLLCGQLTAARVGEFLLGDASQVERYEMAGIGALNFVLTHAPGREVTRSLAIDAHGKCQSSVLLDLEF